MTNIHVEVRNPISKQKINNKTYPVGSCFALTFSDTNVTCYYMLVHHTDVDGTLFGTKFINLQTGNLFSEDYIDDIGPTMSMIREYVDPKDHETTYTIVPIKSVQMNVELDLNLD